MNEPSRQIHQSRTVDGSWAAAGGLLLLGLLILFGPSLRPGFFPYGTDTVSHDYPCLRWAWDEIAESGRLPLWNPYIFCGIPTLGSLMVCPFYPTHWLFGLLPFPTAFTLQYLLAFGWGGMGAWLLARRWGLSPGAAVIVSVAFGLTGHLVTLTYAGHLQKVLALAWLPWAWAGWSAVAVGRWRGGVLLAAVAVAMQLLASHPQIAYYTITAGILVLVARAIDERSTQKQTIQWARLGAAFVTSLLLAGALSAVQLLPLLEMSAVSNRADGVSYEEAVATSYPPDELLEIVLPRFRGDSVRGGHGAYWGAWGERIVSDYAGASLCLLVMLGILLTPLKRTGLWILIWALAATVAVGRHTPLYGWLYETMPGFDRFRSPGTIMALMALAWAMMAGHGVDRLQEAIPTAPSRITRYVGWGGFCCFTAVFVLCLLNGSSEPKGPRSFMWNAVTIGSGFAALTVFCLAIWAGTRRQLTWTAPLVLTGIIGADLIAANSVFVQSESAGRYENTLREADPEVALADQLPPVRLLYLDNEFSNRFMLHRITSLTGYHPISFGKYEQLLSNLGGYNSAPVLDTFGISHMVTPRDSERRAHPIPNIFRSPQKNTFHRDDPRPLIAGQYESPGLVEHQDPWNIRLTSAVANRGGDEQPATNKLASGIRSKAEWISHSPNELTFHYTAPADGEAVTPFPYAAGWRLWMDGEETPLRPDMEHGFFRAFPVTKGRHEIRMRYEPFSFRLGLFISLAAWSYAVAWSIGLWRVRRDSRRTA